jgi:hypothetical protein
MWLIRFFLFILFFISPIAVASNQIVHFEPEYIEINGVIRTLHFPGPPNYESVKNGDADESGPYIILDNPIDVTLIRKFQNEDDIDMPEKNVKLLQLVVQNNNDWAKIKDGNYVHIAGTLFHAHTGHHHARILLTIKKIKVISKQKIDNNDKLDLTDEDKEFLNRK